MRYLPLTDSDRQEMLAAIGVADVEALYKDVAKDVLLDAPVDLPAFKGELEVEQIVGGLAAKNLGAGAAPFFLGAGNYSHHIPAAADHLIQRSEFLTSYTPYQPEVSQGTLQALFEFQTQVAMITGMEVANASLYDGATAASEGAMMACRITRRNKVVLSGSLHPHYAEVTATNAKYLDIEIERCPADPEDNEDLIAKIDDATACVIVQNPGFFGQVRDLSALAEACHDKGALLVVAITEIVSLGALISPGEMGADIVAAEGQSIGNSLNFGGPHVGLFAVREKYLRQMPGRLAGETDDVEGKRGWVLTLSTREQHIRREKATSNICTNSGLCALAFSVHLTLLGEAGFTRLADVNHANAVALAEQLESLSGVELINDTFFNEFTLRLNKPAAGVVDTLAAQGILAGVPASRVYPDNTDLKNLLIVAVTETVTPDDRNQLVAALEEALA
jgi:glycine dehydrogenase subunit 1